MRRPRKGGPLLLRAAHGGAPADAAAARPGRTSHAPYAAASGPSRLGPRAAGRLPNFVPVPLAVLLPPRSRAGPRDPCGTERLPPCRPVEVASPAPAGASQTGRGLPGPRPLGASLLSCLALRRSRPPAEGRACATPPPRGAVPEGAVAARRRWGGPRGWGEPLRRGEAGGGGKRRRSPPGAALTSAPQPFATPSAVA